jgi:hypothetical protein
MLTVSLSKGKGKMPQTPRTQKIVILHEVKDPQFVPLAEKLQVLRCAQNDRVLFLPPP